MGIVTSTLANGIPPLLNPSNLTSAITQVLTLDSIFNLLTAKAPVWGIFQNGNQVLNPAPDSIISLDFKKEWSLPNYPQELGAFQSYNKVTMPYDARIRMTKGGLGGVRNAFLESVDTIAASLDLYDIVTPDRTYLNANINHYDITRSAVNGVELLTVDIYLTEIRNTVVASFSNVKQPSSANQKAVQSNPGASLPPLPTVQ